MRALLGKPTVDKWTKPLASLGRIRWRKTVQSRSMLRLGFGRALFPSLAAMKLHISNTAESTLIRINRQPEKGTMWLPTFYSRPVNAIESTPVSRACGTDIPNLVAAGISGSQVNPGRNGTNDSSTAEYFLKSDQHQKKPPLLPR